MRSIHFLFILGYGLLLSTADAASKVRVVLVGDSTVTDNAGWGLGFEQFVDPARVQVINTSQGGRSSMSFIKEGRWDKALAIKGDYYLIQFGHNDEPGKPGRSTSLDEYRGYMNRYVDDARAAGAIPVLVTSLVRRQFDKSDDHKINSSLESHVAIVKEIASAKHVALIDLHARSKELCERMGREGCLVFSPTKVVEGKSQYDGTHLNAEGYVLIGRLVAEELSLHVPALARLIRKEPVNSHPRAIESNYQAVVSADGSGTHTTVQAALTAVPENGTKPFAILVKPGVYQGQFIVPKTKRFVHLVGEELTNTIITYPHNVNDGPESAEGTFKGTGFVVLADDFSAENLTFENTSGDHGQALAVRTDGDRVVFRHCRLLGWQDTLMVNNGRVYFDDCHIEGRVDFIYGSATAVFEDCDVLSKDGGHITAASTPKGQRYGFVFLHCRLTSDPKPWDPKKPQSNKPLADLGRPWRPFARVVYIECELGDHLKPEGWDNWGKPANEKTAYYAEYNSRGAGANPSARVAWSHQLTNKEAKTYTLEAILSGADGWKPSARSP